MGLLGRRNKTIMVGISEEATEKFPVVIQKFSQDDRFEIQSLQADIQKYYKSAKEIAAFEKKLEKLKTESEQENIDLIIEEGESLLKNKDDKQIVTEKTSNIRTVQFLAGVKSIEGKEIDKTVLLQIDSQYIFDTIYSEIMLFQSEKKVDDVAKN